MMKNKILLLSFGIVNFVSQIYIFFLHQGKLDTTGIEAIKELNLYIMIPGILILLLLAARFFSKNKILPKLLQFTGLLSLSVVIYIMAVHSGARQGVSLFEHPQYMISVIMSIGIIVFSDTCPQKTAS